MPSVCYDVVVVGGGPAGLAAACSAMEAGASSVVIVERDAELGGILRQCVHTGFGLRIFREDLTGPEYAERWIERVRELGVEQRTGAFALSLNADGRVKVVSATRGVEEIRGKAIVLAMGCREKTRGALAIPGTRPSGVWTAGTAQRLINVEGYLPGRRIVIAGSGDVGLIMARRLHLEGAEVQGVIEIAPFPGGLMRNVVQCLEDYRIPLLLSHAITEIGGRRRVEWVKVAGVGPDLRPARQLERVIECDTVLLSVGLIPENELSREAGIAIDPKTGGAVVTQYMETSLPGVFACGNVVHVNDLVDNVSDEAIVAGREAAAFACRRSARVGRWIDVKGGDRVRSVVPQRVSSAGVNTVTLDLRVTEVIDHAVVEVATNDRVLATHKRRRVRPGEMVRIPLAASHIDSVPFECGSIRVSVAHSRAQGGPVGSGN
ncbi:MAG: FAD-dependent oxidoreductase [Firmicutes bacterium]|nr:FAD-dependent oxidoreductase [Bacillota bacterium]